MDTLELYQGLKTGKIKKSQLNEQQIGDVYKYMVNSKKVSVNQIKPETVKKFNLSNNTSNSANNLAPIKNETYSPFKIQTNFNTSNYEQPKIKPITQQTKSTNPENELVDLLSNLSMNRGKTVTNLRSQVGPTAKYLPKVDNPIGNIKANYGLGKLSEDENQAWSKYRTTQSPEDLKLAQSITAEKEKYMQENETGKGNWITKDFAQYFPQQINQLKAGIGEALPGALTGATTFGGTAAILGQAGPQIAIPEEVITVPAAATMGAYQGGKLGYIKGVGEYSYNNMAGSAYKNLLDLGVPNDIALKASQDEGVINSLIEAVGAGVDIATLGLRKLFTSPADTAAKKLVKNKLTSALKAYGINIASEGLEELSQEGVSIASEKQAMKQSGLERTATNEDDLKRMLEAGYGGVKIATVSGGGNAIGNIAVNTVNNKMANNQTEKYNQQINNLQVGIDEDLKILYNGLDNNNVKGDNLDGNIEVTKQILEATKKAYPELADFFDNHINKLNEYKTKATVQPQANENIEVEQLVNDNTEVAQNSINDVTDDIKENNVQPIESVVEMPTVDEKSVIEEQKIEEISPIMKEEIPTETIENKVIEQQDDIREQEFPIGGTILNKNGTEYQIKSWDKDIATIVNTITNEESKRTIGSLRRLGSVINDKVDIVNKDTKVMQKKEANELNSDNPYLEDDFNPFEQENEFEEQYKKREKWLRDNIENIKTGKFTKSETGNDSLYATVTPSVKEGKYQLTTFDNKDVPLSDGQYSTLDEVAKELDYNGFTYIDEINYNKQETTAIDQTPTKDNKIATIKDSDVVEEIKTEANELTDIDVGNIVKSKETQKNKESTSTQNYTGEQSFKGSKPVTNSSVVDMNRKLKSITDIKKDISKLFNISISNKTNKFAKRKALGYYKVMPEVIRTKYNNQLGVVMHELGHHLDKQYQFNSKSPQLIKGMINKMDENFKKAYKDSELPGEAVAEFLRYYTTDAQAAKEFAGDFYNLFEQTLDKKDLKNIQDVRSDVLRWVNAEQDEKALSTIIAVNKDKKSFNEKVNAEEINMMLFDDLISLDRFSKTVENTTGKKLNPKDNPYYLALMTRKNSTIINGILEGDTIDSNLKVINNKDNLNKIIDDVGKDLNMFELYLKRKHALTLQSQGHQIFSNEIVLNQETIDMMEKQYPNFEKQSERLYEWYDTFFKAWVIDTNMLGKDSKKIYEAMREQYPFYVPMFRSKNSLMGDKSLKTAGSNFTDQKSPVDRLSEKGSDRDTISPLDGIIMQVNRIVNAQTKNNVMRSIVKQYNNVDGLGMFIDRVKPDMEKKMIETQGLKNKLEKDFEKVLNPDDLEAIIDSIDDVLESYSPLGYSKDNDIITMIAKDGSRQFYEVFDANLLKSISNLNRNQLEFIDNILPSIRRSMTALTTGLNPIFGVVSNFPRDIQQAYAFGSYKNPFEYGRETAKALYEVLSKSDNYKEFMSTGGGQAASLFGADRKMIDAVSKTLDKRRSDKKINLRNSFDYMIESIETFNDLIETTPRLAEYNKAYKIAKSKGMNEYDAKLSALTKSNDVTLNFLKRGTIMNSTIAQSIPYLNAGLQGLDKLKRGLITDKETRKQTWGKVIVSMTLPTILLWLAHKDDEDYDKLSKGIKDNYWILWKNNDGSFVRLPKPKDLAGLFSSDFERGLNALFKEKGADAFDGFLLTILNSLIPPMDTILRPINDVNKNKKWSGGTIVSQSLQGLTKRNQYDDTTSNIAITLSRGISKVSPNSMLASPKNMHYLIDQYFGGLGDILLPMTTPNSYTDVDRLKDKYGYLALPLSVLGTTKEIVKRRTTADPSYSNDVINDFYAMRDKTMKANKSFDNKGDFTKDVDFAAEKEFKLYYNTISSYWKDIDYIGSLQNKQLSDSQVRIFKNLINYSRFEDKAKNEVIENLKNKKLNQSSITLLQKTIRDEIVNLANKALTGYKEYHKSNNEKYKELLKTED